MDRKAPPPTSRTRNDATGGGTDGFTLLEIVCALAIVATIAALIFPAIPHGTSRLDLEGYAMQTAALLKHDRQAANRLQRQVATQLDSSRRTIRSGATGATVSLPADVAFNAIFAKTCRGIDAGPTIQFFPSGMSCGGTIVLSRLGATLQVRVNWLTGGVEIVSANAS